MKRSKISILVVGLAFSCAVQAGTDDIKVANNQIGFQMVSTNVDYAETGGQNGAAAGLMDTENGHVGGFSLWARLMKDEYFKNSYFEISYTRHSGNTQYLGSYIGSNQPYGSVESSDSATMNDYSVSFGKGFVLSSQVMLTPYLQLGHHQWDRGLGSYSETYSNGYYGVGAMLQYSPVQKLVFTANALVGNTYSSNIDTTTADLPSANLGNSSLTRFGVAVDYAFNNRVHVNAGYDRTRFNYGISGVNAYGYYEPNSSTAYNTFSVGLSYAF